MLIVNFTICNVLYLAYYLKSCFFTASNTSSGLICSMHTGFSHAEDIHSLQDFGFDMALKMLIDLYSAICASPVGEKRAMVGVPTATAICMGPVSFVIKRAHLSIAAEVSRRVNLPASEMPPILLAILCDSSFSLLSPVIIMRISCMVADSISPSFIKFFSGHLL